MSKFRKKPVVVEACQWNGDFDELKSWFDAVGKPDDFVKIVGKEPIRIGYEEFARSSDISIFTLEGEHTAQKGDYIIQGVHGEYYPCKPDIFEETYERVNEQ